MTEKPTGLMTEFLKPIKRKIFNLIDQKVKPLLEIREGNSKQLYSSFSSREEREKFEKQNK